MKIGRGRDGRQWSSWNRGLARGFSLARPTSLGRRDHLLAGGGDRRTVDASPPPITDRQAASERAAGPLLAARPPPNPFTLGVSVDIIATDRLLPLREPPCVRANRQVMLEGPMPSNLAVGVPQRGHSMPLVMPLRTMFRTGGCPPIVASVQKQRRGEQRERLSSLSAGIGGGLHDEFPRVVETAAIKLFPADVPANQLAVKTAVAIFGLLRLPPAGEPPFGYTVSFTLGVSEHAHHAPTRVRRFPDTVQFARAKAGFGKKGQFKAAVSRIPQGRSVFERMEPPPTALAKSVLEFPVSDEAPRDVPPLPGTMQLFPARRVSAHVPNDPHASVGMEFLFLCR